VITKKQRYRRIGDRGSWERNSCVICGMENIKRHGIEGTKKPRKEGQRG